MLNQQQLQAYIAANSATLGTLSDAAAATAINTATQTTMYLPLTLTTPFLYDTFQEAASTILANFRTIATAQPWSDFLPLLDAGGIPVNSPTGVAMLGQLTQTSPPVLTEAQLATLTGMTVQQNYQFGQEVQTSDVTTARAAIAQASTAAALVQQIQQGFAAAMALVQTYQNGPTSGTAPTAAAIQSAFNGAVTG
jgi:hypothetical protein